MHLVNSDNEDSDSEFSVEDEENEENDEIFDENESENESEELQSNEIEDEENDDENEENEDDECGDSKGPFEPVEYVPLEKYKMGEPLCRTLFYKLERTGPENTLVINVKDLTGNFEKKYVCNICYLNDEIKCYKCIRFYKYDCTFLIETKFALYKIPPPTFFSAVNMNFFKNWITNILKMFDEYDKTTKERIEEMKHIETVKYNTFISKPFNNGLLSDQLSGKKSMVRTTMLAKIMPSMRLILTIDTQLGFDEISIPKIVYDKLNLATDYVIYNRAPSINDTCIYVGILKWHEDSYTCKISAFVADGLHADQDGDEISIFYIPKTKNIKSYNETLMYKELDAAKTSRRFDGTSKYTPGQYYQYVMYTFHDKFCEIIPFYKDLPCSKSEKPKFLFNMLMSSKIDQATKIISDIIQLSKNLLIKTPSVKEILEAKLEDIVESGSKGTINHLKEFKNTLSNTNEEEHSKKCVANFNKFIKTSSIMSNEGRLLYSSIFGGSAIELYYNNIKMMGVIVEDNFYGKPITYQVQYNQYDIRYLKSLILRDAKKQKEENMKLLTVHEAYHSKIQTKTNNISVKTHNKIVIQSKTKKQHTPFINIDENIKVLSKSIEIEEKFDISNEKELDKFKMELDSSTSSSTSDSTDSKTKKRKRDESQAIQEEVKEKKVKLQKEKKDLKLKQDLKLEKKKDSKKESKEDLEKKKEDSKEDSSKVFKKEPIKPTTTKPTAITSESSESESETKTTDTSYPIASTSKHVGFKTNEEFENYISKVKEVELKDYEHLLNLSGIENVKEKIHKNTKKVIINNIVRTKCYNENLMNVYATAFTYVLDKIIKNKKDKDKKKLVNEFQNL